MRVLDLFSGIGGFSLGLERAGFRTVAFCEIDPYCRRVLAKHWPEVPCFDDVRTLNAARLDANGIAADVICGGFPCQDVSLAGKGAGIDGPRSGLWREFARLIGELRPRYAIIENDHGLLHRGLGRVLGDLAGVGYDAEWSRVSACSLGFPHMRRRLWLVAYPASRRGQQRGRLEFAQGGDQTRDIHQRFSEPEPVRVATGVPDRMDRNRALGNAVVPQIPEMIGRAILAREALP
jgi:DNA (cytosine-5)-methyltransferase 1